MCRQEAKIIKYALFNSRIKELLLSDCGNESVYMDHDDLTTLLKPLGYSLKSLQALIYLNQLTKLSFVSCLVNLGVTSWACHMATKTSCLARFQFC